MSRTTTEPKFIDNGAAPEFFANGLYDVQVMGAVSRFITYVERRSPSGVLFFEPAITLIIPNSGIGPAIALTCKRLGSDLVIPTVTDTARKILSLN